MALSFKNKKLNTYYHNNNITFIGIFGSYAKNIPKKDSDVDLMVKFSKRKTLLDLVRIERELSEILGKKVDLLTEKSISPYLIDTINQDLKIVYKTD